MNELRVARPSGRSTTSALGFPLRSTGVYDAIGRGARRTPTPRSSRIWGGISDTTLAYREIRAVWPSNAVAVDRGAAHLREPLEHQNLEPGTGEVCGRDETVVTGPDHHDVVAGAHSVQPSEANRRETGRTPRRNMQSSTIVDRDMPAITVDDLTVLDRLREPGLGDQPRPVWQVTTAPTGYEGEGFPVRRAFAGIDLAQLDPFIMMDQMGEVEYAPGEPKGTPGTRTAASRPSRTSSTASSTTRTATVAAAASPTATPSG